MVECDTILARIARSPIFPQKQGHKSKVIIEMCLPHYRFGFVMEQALGHVTHSQNLARWLRDDPSVQPHWLQVPAQADDIWQKIPGVSFRSSLRAWERVRKLSQDLDCLLYHTQGTALFSLGLMHRIPTVVSLDATPINFLAIGNTYGYEAPGGVLDRVKFKWYRRVFQSAAALVSWSNWAKESLVQDYGVLPDKVTVIPPGVDLSYWRATQKQLDRGTPLKLLFVGGDFARKGGNILLEAFRHGLADRCTLDIVTKDETITAEKSVCVHRGLAPNSPQLQQLFADADAFVFPTLGDCVPIVVMEAMASGLPVIATDIGALAEEVADGKTGYLVAPNNPAAIAEAVLALADNPERRIAMGIAGRQRAESFFDGERNYKALVSVMKSRVDMHRASSR